MVSPFIWGQGGEKLSPQQVAQQRQIAAALAARNSAPKDVGEGLARVGDALLYRANMDRATQAENEGRAQVEAALAKLSSGDPTEQDLIQAMGDSWVQNDPGASAVVQSLYGREMQQNDPMYQMGLEKSKLELDALRNPKPEPGFTMLAPDEVQGLGLPPGAYQRGPDGKISDIGGSGQTINVGGNNDIGTIPPGKMVTRDENGNVTGMVDIPGGPSEAERLAAEAKAAAKDQTTDQYGNVVIDDIGRAVDKIKTDPTLTTGLFGSILSNWAGSEAHDVSKLLDTVKVNAAFDRLQQMRDGSPTGAALGSVTERELSLLQSAIGNLEQSQSSEQLVLNLKRVQEIYETIVNGPQARKPEAPSVSPEAMTGEKPPEGWSGDPELWQYMSPEDRALFMNP